MIDELKDFILEMGAREAALRIFTLLAIGAGIFGMLTESYFFGSLCACMVICAYITEFSEQIEEPKKVMA